MNTESASARGENPFLSNMGATEGSATGLSGGPVYDERARGVDGDLLDAMLKGRWQEGHETGYNDGHAAARRRYPGIYDDGFARGHSVGADEAASELARRLLPVLQGAGGVLAEIAEATRSKAIKDLANRQVQAIREVLGDEVGQNTAEARAARVDL